MKNLLKNTTVALFFVLGLTATSQADPFGSAPIAYGSNPSGGGGGGSGTVTSVGLSSPNNVACVVSGSPVTTSGTLVCTPTGTSGGIPYFAGATTLSSSAALTANAPVIGGGAGVAPSVGTKTGNTTTFATATGTLTSGHLAAFDASGNIVDGGAAGAGTVTSLTGGNGILVGASSPCTTACTIDTTVTRNAQTGTTYATLATDGGKIVSLSNASPVAVSLSQANATGFTAGFGTDYNNIGAGLVTVTATTSTFDDGNSTLPIFTGQDSFVYSDSTNYHASKSVPIIASDSFLGNNTAAATYGDRAFTVPSCANDGTHALVFVSHALGCASISAGGSGTVNSGTAVSGAYYAGTGTAVSDASGVRVNFGAVNVSTGTVNLGIGQTSVNTLGLFSVNTARMTISSSAISTSLPIQANNAAGPQLGSNASSSTSPGLVPNRADTTTGFGAQAAGNISGIVGGVEKIRLTAEGIQYKQATAPIPTGTGTPTIATGSTDEAGEVTAGASATSVIITFNLTHTNAPFCVVTQQGNPLAAFAYALSNTAITITQTATSGNKIDYRCTFP